MQKAKQRFQDIRQKLQERGFYDPRLLGLVVLAIIGLSVVWNGAQVVQQNYELSQKVAVLEEENRILELENRNKEIQNEYYKTLEFAELKARRVNGRAAPGESVYIVTRDVALESLQTPEEVEQSAVQTVVKPQYQQNFEAWIDFFFGRRG